ncbi:hypothetical protein GCM10022281_07820 [Sphingomonas rosea]|uniref:Uncharacterized protein n=1 Tax=Sphingomonas rosea TaxID=335605 RepID=A0ABP7TSZ2_9SPHN
MWWLAGLIALQPVPGVAAPGSRDFDMQCMLVTQQAASALPDKDMALMAQIAAMFFMGRVDSSVTQAQLGALAEQAAGAIKGKPIGPILQSCGDFMQRRGKIFEQVGTEVEGREQGRATR